MIPAKFNCCQASLAEFLAVCSLGDNHPHLQHHHGNTKTIFNVDLATLALPTLLATVA